MTRQKLAGRILTPQGWISGSVEFGEQVICISEEQRPAPGCYILPGFVDLHVHGGAGSDVMQGAQAVATMARMHARHGTTAMLATTMTAHTADIEKALHGIARTIETPDASAARILGVHLEGPFISHLRLGAQPALVQEASIALVQRWHQIAPIRILTLASELGAHLSLIPQLSALGIRVQLGHSAGTYEDAAAAIEAGASGFTHLFNGMTGFQHREPGIAGAALAHATYAELIPDFQHVHTGAIRAALRAIPKLYGVTDATAAAGMPDGEYDLGSQRVMKCFGCVRLVDGSSLAGSALTMDQAFRNWVALGLDVADASDRLSRFPADYLRLTDQGRVEPGCRADIVVFNQDLQLQSVYLNGRCLEQAGPPKH